MSGAKKHVKKVRKHWLPFLASFWRVVKKLKSVTKCRTYDVYPAKKW